MNSTAPINVTISNDDSVLVTLGNTGPQGVPGPQGVAGPPGIPGPAGAGVTWVENGAVSIAMQPGTGYVMNNPSLVTAGLPQVIDFGQQLAVFNKGVGGWLIQQNPGQTIHFDGNSTTQGIGGFLQSLNQFEGVTLLCITANTDFLVIGAIGNISGF